MPKLRDWCKPKFTLGHSEGPLPYKVISSKLKVIAAFEHGQYAEEFLEKVTEDGNDILVDKILEIVRSATTGSAVNEESFIEQLLDLELGSI